MVEGALTGVSSLVQECDWLIQREVNSLFKHVHEMVKNCCKKYPISVNGCNFNSRQDTFVLNSQQSLHDQAKCVVTIQSDLINQADISIKLYKHQPTVHRTSISLDNPWKLQQIQDSANHLQKALCIVENVIHDGVPNKSSEVLYHISKIMNCLNLSKSSLLIPKKRTIEELLHSSNMSLNPALPADIAVSFYLQGPKLTFAAYHILHHHGTTKFDTLQAEAYVPWTQEVLTNLTLCLRALQQFKDKMSVFVQYGQV